MRIGGVNDISSLYVLNNKREIHHRSFTLSNTDTFSISEAAQRFNASLQKSSRLVKAEITESLPPFGKEIDNAMKKAVNILERIGELSVLAQDETLVDADRLELQIEIEDLRDNLQVLPRNLMTGEKWATNSQLMNSTGELSLRPSADGTTLLERAATRALNVEEWDIREVWNPGEVRVSVDDEGNQSIEEIAAGWYAVDDENVYTRDENGKFIESGRKVPTVRERIEACTIYSVMDSESAAKTQARIEKDIESIQKWRENLPDMIENLNDEESTRIEAYLFLREIIFPGGISTNSLAIPDSPNYFQRDGKIYDTPYNDTVITEREAVGDLDINAHKNA